MTESAQSTARSPEDRQLAEELVERARAEGVELVNDAGGLLAGLAKSVLEASLEAEMSEHLGYDRYDPAGREKGSNCRNGTRSKKVLTDVGPVQINVPRDRNGSFEPKIVKKRQRRLAGVDEIVISLTAKGLTTGEVQAHMAEVYGSEVSRDTISKITDRVIGKMSEWQNRPLDRFYPVVSIDALAVNIHNGQVTNRPVYTAIGVTADGTRDILGLWIGSGGEGAEYWLQVLTEIKNRGVEDVCIVVCDGLKGLLDAIENTWSLAIARKQTDLPSVSIKQVYEHPTISSLATALTAPVPTATERLLGDVLADIMSVDRVSVGSHFFDDLGADSMVMTRFCARLRKQTDLPSVSIKQVYEHPTINSLATALAGAAPASDSTSAQVATPASAQAVAPAGTLSYVLCGALQLLTLLGYFSLITFAWAGSYDWIFAGSSLAGSLIRLVAVGNGIILGMGILPILVKWMLVGRWKPQEIRVWSLEYFRFWVVKTLVQLNPLAVSAGSPVYVLYLRALGAKIGPGAVILSRHVPVCADLLTIGENTVIRKDSVFNCYRAHAGLIQTGPVTLGRDVHVGEMTVLDIDTSMGDGAQLGHSSTLIAGQVIPAGERRCGSPARERTEVDYLNVARTDSGLLRKVAFSAAQLLGWLVLSSLAFSAVIAVSSIVGERSYFAAPETRAFSEWTFYGDAVVISGVLFFGSILVRLVLVVAVPRVLNLAIRPDKVYPLYGYHYFIHRAIGRITNVKFFMHLFGDSSYIVYYLRWLGYDLSEGVVQTGSNFGSAVKHDNPYLVSIGRGTMIADGLSMINADYSSTSFRVSRVMIGSDNFLGNQVAYPSQGKTGDNCLLASKVMVPVDGAVRKGVGLLGSPSFEIPRSVWRDSGLDHPKSDEELGRQLAAKNRHNLVTAGLFLLLEWLFFVGSALIAFSATELSQTAGWSVFGLAMLFTLLFRVFYQVSVERAATLFRSLQPQRCSIYAPYFWFHERYWKLAVRHNHLTIFAGTPLKSLAWRLMGVQIGKRVFDDGCAITERTLVAIGDNCALNVGSVVQSHSQEDGGFKSDRIAIGAGCTIGVGALVHYGATMGDGAQLAPGAFLMKGEEVPAHTSWGSNPAMDLQDDYSAPAAPMTTKQMWDEEELSIENYEIPVTQTA